MLAGLLILAILTGTTASGVALMLSMPLWVAILAYPLAGTTALVLAGTIACMVQTARREDESCTAELQPLHLHSPR